MWHHPALDTLTKAPTGNPTFTYGYQYNQTAATDPRVGFTTGTKQDHMPYTLTKSGSPVLQTLRTYEARRDALAAIQNNAGTITRSSHTYTVNPLGQRTNLTAFDLGGAHTANPGATAWSYDSLGQLESAAAPGTAADRYFAYDAIGNRLESRSETATNSGGALTEYFGKLTPSPVAGANAINQYVGIKKGATTIEPGYDDDGNATAYPVPAYPTANSTLGWDAENRLIRSTVNGVLTTHFYDAQSRKISTTTGTTTTLYLYDGFNCIAEYEGGTGVSPVLKKTRLWGLDLSGMTQGAGGVGGLLCESQISNSQISNYHPTYDGNGNVSEYLEADGDVAAHYEYDPFGNIVKESYASGFDASSFTYKFSTKPLDPTTGLYYYLYRYYDPLTGRWPSRDPIQERGGVNLYGFVENRPVDEVDYLGESRIRKQYTKRITETTLTYVCEANSAEGDVTAVDTACCGAELTESGSASGRYYANTNLQAFLDLDERLEASALKSAEKKAKEKCAKGNGRCKLYRQVKVEPITSDGEIGWE